jgi:hypothetical protein
VEAACHVSIAKCFRNLCHFRRILQTDLILIINISCIISKGKVFLLIGHNNLIDIIRTELLIRGKNAEEIRGQEKQTGLIQTSPEPTLKLFGKAETLICCTPWLCLLDLNRNRMIGGKLYEFSRLMRRNLEITFGIRRMKMNEQYLGVQSDGFSQRSSDQILEIEKVWLHLSFTTDE